MNAFVSFEIVRPVPAEFPKEPVGAASALRVILSYGGKVVRRSILDEWRAGDVNFGRPIAERFVEALVDQGYLTPVFAEEPHELNES